MLFFKHTPSICTSKNIFVFATEPYTLPTFQGISKKLLPIHYPRFGVSANTSAESNAYTLPTFLGICKPSCCIARFPDNLTGCFSECSQASPVGCIVSRNKKDRQNNAWDFAQTIMVLSVKNKKIKNYNLYRYYTPLQRNCQWNCCVQSKKIICFPIHYPRFWVSANRIILIKHYPLLYTTHVSEYLQA